MRKAMQICALFLLAVLAACDQRRPAAGSGRKTIVATYSVLGSVAKELAGDEFEVRTLIPNGMDIHEWEPSARDIEALTRADLIVENGLELEGGLGKALDQARKAGVRFFTASDHVTVRVVGVGEGIPTGDPDQAPGARDPHLWTDPLAMKAVAGALAGDIRKHFGKDLSARNEELGKGLDALDAEIRQKVERLPVGRRKLVTGHESLGYFAQRYGFTLVGAVIPGLSTEGAGSAATMAHLKKLIREKDVKVIFTEVGTSPRTVEALARETQVRAVPLATHTLPGDGSYRSFERELAATILKELQ
ncbi:metal ABC transporter substrate-binding protein [Holophaga foetida]|uniref:metal ABC transporter substrate-binding protein n=1 Tax=Holophaga foetida TaxID=35839 RepID=UPI0002472188|nr:metal ABC transporter substrate-binding protein [Holophaga foetida]